MLFTGKVVMIVDDSYTIRHQVKLLLKKYNIIVIEAHNKASMLNQLHYKGRLVNLILMDLGLKDTTGFDLMEYLQNTPNYKHIPIIVLTGDATKNTVIEAASAFKIEHYAIKPIDPISLSNKVLTVLEKQHFSEHSDKSQDVTERLQQHKADIRSSLPSKPSEPISASSDNLNLDDLLKNALIGNQGDTQKPSQSNEFKKDKMHTNVKDIHEGQK